MEKTLAGKGSVTEQGLSFFGFATACAFSFLIASNCFASTISLQWDPVTTQDLAGYKVYYSTSNQTPFTGTGATQGTSPVAVTGQTTATITGLDPAIPYYFAVTAYSSTGVESRYSNIIEVPELVSPMVSIISPAASTSANGTVSVTANASDNVGVTSLEFYVNGTLQATQTTTPYLYSWDTSTVASGSYTLMAKAYDAAGNVGESQAVSVTVTHDTTAPAVTLSAPGSGATVHGAVPITATATDDTGVTKVEFFANGTLLSAGNVAPYSFNWDTTAVSNGSYTISSKAYDAQGNVGQAAVSVNVLNDSSVPTVSIASPVSNATASGSTLVSVNASDNVGVNAVEFYVNGALLGTTTSAPYNFNWNTAALANGYYTLTAKAYDATGNIGQSASVAVKVLNDTTAPSISFLAPTTTYVYTSKVTVKAAATDNVAVVKMQLYVDGILKSTTTSGSLSVPVTINKGLHSIVVKALDSSNNLSSKTMTVQRVF